MDEKQYRLMVKDIFARVEDAFEEVDPDLAEVESSSGTCAILIHKGRSKIIVSPQPPVQQIWFANASAGVALHFSFDANSSKWLDDKNASKELFEEISNSVQAACGVRVSF
jgi:iron donor protein CyaY